MAIINTYQNVLGIVELVTRKWPKEQKERLLRELAAANQESSGGKSGKIELDKKEK